jgi:hypothetical protein
MTPVLKGGEEEYIFSLCPHQREANQAVCLFLTAIGECLYQAGIEAKIMRVVLHRIFPPFGRIMGLSEDLLEVDNGRCRAVSIYLQDDTPRKGGGCWMYGVVLHYIRNKELIENHSEKEKIREVARVACHEWNNSWKLVAAE